ncbi:ZP domain-containing protein [Etheostoma spectabile]|uniref:ZP domain-containing protein n=1 Tax=Etheostoma spectabile TaxID=54343 RepID=UPI0013AF89E0|nr:ZP domain-containing protein-like [Etheostoma spectabile]
MLKGPVLAAWLVYLLCHVYPVKSGVICDESKMTIAVEKSKYRKLVKVDFRINDVTNAACRLSSNSTHFFADVPLNGCGTQVEENGENLIFKNTVTLVTHPKDVIIRKCLLELKFECNYPKSVQVKQSFSAHRKNVIESEKGLGTFTYKFEFYPDKEFQTPLAPDTYPLDCDSEQTLYMQIEVASSIENTELFVESCSASPYDIPNYKTTYPIIDKGCAKDPTVVNYSRPHDTKFQFSMEAFKFIGLHEQVYISCSVMICRLGRPDTRCSQGCVNSRLRRDDQRHHLIKREVVTQSSRHFVSQGPLRLRRSAESPMSPVINLNLNLVFIAGCLLAAVGMISSAVIYKAKISRDKYQPLPAFEN